MKIEELKNLVLFSPNLSLITDLFSMTKCVYLNFYERFILDILRKINQCVICQFNYNSYYILYCRHNIYVA